MINICLIGLGNFGMVIYNKIEEIQGMRVISCYHPELKKAKAFNPEKGTDNLDAAILCSDAVIITTPNDKHYEFIKKACSYRKPVFVEKPITSKYEDAIKIKPNSDGNFIMVGHNQRREGVYRLAKKLIDENNIGKIISVYFNLSHGGAFSFKKSQWRYSFERHKEGPLITAGIHIIDTVHYLFGRVDSVFAKIKNLTKETDAPDCNSVILTLQNGASVYLESNYNIASEELCAIRGTEGTIYINRGSLSLRKGRDVYLEGKFVSSSPINMDVKEVDTIREELVEFKESILDGHYDCIETGLQEGINAMAVIEACNQSNKLKKEIKMNSFKEYFANSPS